MSEADQETVFTKLYNLYNGFTYTPFECEFVGDPRLDEGDYVYLTNTRDGDIGTYIFNYVFTNGATEKIEAPSCDELDKNFLDANKKKQSDAESKLDQAYNNTEGGGSGEAEKTYTHDEYADLNKPTVTYLSTEGVTMRISFLLQPTMNGEILGADGTEWYIVAYARSKNFEPYSGTLNVEVHTTNEYDINNYIAFTSSGLNSSNSRELCPYVEFKFYKSDEYQKFYKMFGENLNTVDRWPILYNSNPTQIDNKCKLPLGGELIIPIEVITPIVSVDPYFNVREYQLAQAMYNMFTMLGIANFSSIFSSVEDVYHYLLAFRVEADQGDEPTGGEEGEEGGEGEGGEGEGGEGGGETDPPDPEPGFENPLPAIESAVANLEPENKNGSCAVYYTYSSSENTITVDFNYMSYTDWVSKQAVYEIDLSTITSDNSDTFTYSVEPTSENIVYQAITAIGFTFDTANNKIYIECTYNTTDEEELNSILSQTIEITQS